MLIFATENAIGFEILESGELISLSNINGTIQMDKEQLLALLAMARPWAEKGHPLKHLINK